MDKLPSPQTTAEHAWRTMTPKQRGKFIVWAAGGGAAVRNGADPVDLSKCLERPA